jgi:hypothetical protein
MYIVKPFARFISVLCDFYAKRKITKSRRLPKMDCVFVKARKISKALKSNRGSAVNYSKYLTRELPGIDYTEKGNILASGIEGTTEKPLEFWQKAEDRENQTKRKATARFAKEYIVALPHNLPIDEQSKICKTLAEKLSKGGRVVQWVHHEPDKEGSDKNFHCHFLMSERTYQNGIFADTKNREWNSKKCLADHKREIGNEINLVLEKFHLPKIKVEIEEETETVQDRTERQIRAERAEKKTLSKAEKKIKLAEVKLNGLRGFETRPGNTIDGNSELNKSVAERERREELERQHQLAEQQRKLDLQRAEELRRQSQKRPTKSVGGYDGPSW